MAGLADAEIAMLCDIGEFDSTKASDEQKRHLDHLVEAGYIEPAADNPASSFRPTPKGAAFLTERGVGLNEA